MDVINTIQAGLVDVRNNWLTYLIALMVVSALSMALIQAVKEMSSVRLDYNKRRLGSWLLNRARQLRAGQPEVLAAKAEEELRRLASDSDVFAFYGGDVTSLCTQFSAAATILLDYPNLNPELFRMLTVYGTEADIDLLLSCKPPAPVPLIPSQQYDRAELVKAAEERQGVIDARNRVRHQLTQSIASFQIETGSRWERLMKIWSWIVSTTLTFILGALAGQLAGDHVLLHFTALLLAAAVSGFLAPIARDLVAAMQNLRD